jgi:hypothetical protein
MTEANAWLDRKGRQRGTREAPQGHQRSAQGKRERRTERLAVILDNDDTNGWKWWTGHGLGKCPGSDQRTRDTGLEV